MEQMQPQPLPHLVQVYQPSDAKIQNSQIITISHPSLPTSQGKVTYQQAITSEAITIPVSSHITDIQAQQLTMPQNQIVMPCQQGMPSNMSQTILPSHMIVPQHMLVNTMPPFYDQYECPKDQCILAKLEPDVTIVEKETEIHIENTSQTEPETGDPPKRRPRSQIPDPSLWACNVRKQKHQQGEAYVSRRGKYVPEKRIKTTKDCTKSCKYKCSEKISYEDRQHIFKAFYSLDANDKKYFLLNTTDRIYIKHRLPPDSKRQYTFKYFFTIRSEKHVVCKNFYLGTLAISQKPVYNVHNGKTDLNMPKPDGRGHSVASLHSLPCEVKDGVRKHIMSFKTIDSKNIIQHSKKRQYLERKLTVKKMYNMYVSQCNKDNIPVAKLSMYRKIFKQDFNLHFKKTKSTQPLCGRCKCLIKKEP